jgi:hypothetical protein
MILGRATAARVLQKRRKRNQQVDWNFFPLEQTSHFNHVVGASPNALKDDRAMMALAPAIRAISMGTSGIGPTAN